LDPHRRDDVGTETAKFFGFDGLLVGKHSPSQRSPEAKSQYPRDDCGKRSIIKTIK